MTEKKSLHGFKLTRKTYIKELSANLYNMMHERSGAELIYLERPDENKTFAIGFKTLPDNDTGVFHILEHSVLSGSEKYPVRDPLSELMKSSLYTYVNAFTYPDKTLYPVSSKNSKAFHDLISVYMDAVFHPLAMSNENIFLSEGIRFEPTSEGLSLNGVVYNEMKGAYSSPEELTEHYLMKQLFSGGTYGMDSGGFPESIPALGYDEFKRAHERFYAPENSCIFLDGNMELPSVLELIDRTLPDASGDFRPPEITLGRLDTEGRVEYFSAEEGESTENRGRLTLGYRGYSHSDAERTLAVSVILDAIADGNTSPLKKRILDEHLCENMYIYYSSGAAVGTLCVQFTDVSDGKEEELTALFDKTVGDLLLEGLDNDKISAALSRIEFKTREADFGGYPKGMVYMSAALEYALLDEDPVCAFTYDTLFSSLREKLGTDYFDKVLSELISGERATLVLYPKVGYGELCERKCRKRLDEYATSLTREEYRRLTEKHDSYLAWQSTPDTDEALASIPKLSLSDITEIRQEVETHDTKISGTRLLLHTARSAGIIYLDYFFDVSDLTSEERSALRLLCRTLPDMDTEGRSAEDFLSCVKRELGDLGVSLVPIKCRGDVKLYLKLSASALEGKLASALELISERLYKTKAYNPDAVERRVKQMLTHSRISFSEDGSSYALTRTLSRYDDYSALREELFGYDFHRYLIELSSGDKSAYRDMAKSFCDMLRTLLVRERLTLAVTSDSPEEIVKRALSIIPDGKECAGRLEISRPECINEGIAAPSSVGFSAAGTDFLPAGYRYDGSFAVASAMLVYEHLWGEVRLSGGAYDTGFVAREGSGALALYSYRDPTPERSAALFSGLGTRLREVLSSGVDITKYIISSVGATDSYATPRSASGTASLLYLSGKTHEDLKRIRQEMLATDKDSLIAFSEMLDSLSEGATYTLVAPREILMSAGVDRILEI